MSGTSRPLDTGRKDSLGRTVRVSGDAAVSRSDAPTPPAGDDGRYDPPDNRMPDGLSVRKLIEFRRSHATMDVPRTKQAHERIPVRVGDYVVWDSPAGAPRYATVLAARMEKQVSGHDGHATTWAYTGNVEWAIQFDDGSLTWQRFDQRPWRNLSDEGRDEDGAAPPRQVQRDAYMSDGKDLSSAFWRPMESGRAEALGYTTDGFQTVESPNGAVRYIRDTGRTLPETRTRPRVAVYETFEVDTYADDVDGKPTVLARPGARSGEMFVRADLTARSE